ncbi:hypothetical protein, partial [Pseudonocardia pini]|uniref:hypothetical protein n=1 Tax=Pseudonocardia pini TaxID=2758030 RepID=UPI001C688632
MSSRPLSDRAPTGFVEGGRAVTVTREEHHQDVLTRVPLGRTVAELGFCTIGAGKYRGSRGVEVRLAGSRVGELTFRMSERYAELVGPGTGCAATVTESDHGRQVTLWLPAPETLFTGLVTDRLPVVPEPATERFPVITRIPAPRAPAGEVAGAVPSAAASAVVSEVVSAGPRTAVLPGRVNDAGPLIVPGQRGPQRPKRSRRPMWIAAGSVAAVLAAVVMVTGSLLVPAAAPTSATTSAASTT